MDKKNIYTNTDTGFLKIVAFLTMTIDHVGYLFFPSDYLWRVVGRIAFPLFAYCFVLGFIYTKDIKKYFIRLLGFSLISQIPYYLCCYPNDTFQNFHLNIGFTMILGLIACYGVKEKNYLYTVIALVLSFLPQIEYGLYGVCLILLMYLFIFERKIKFSLVVGTYLILSIPVLFFLEISVLQFFAILALPFILVNTKSKIKIPRLINYSFYPLHFIVLLLIDGLR